MRHISSNNRRGGRGKSSSGRSKSVHPRYQSYESNGPDGRLRGMPSQLHEKFVQQARDAQASGDTVRSQSLLQYAEHYFRLGDLGGHSQGDRGSGAADQNQNLTDEAAQDEFGSQEHGRPSPSRRERTPRDSNSRDTGRANPRESGSRSYRDENGEDNGRGRRGSRYGGRSRREASYRETEEAGWGARSSSGNTDHDSVSGETGANSGSGPGFGAQMPAFLGGGSAGAGGSGDADSREDGRKGRRQVRRTPYGTRRRAPSSKETVEDI